MGVLVFPVCKMKGYVYQKTAKSTSNLIKGYFHQLISCLVYFLSGAVILREDNKRSTIIVNTEKVASITRARTYVTTTC